MSHQPAEEATLHDVRVASSSQAGHKLDRKVHSPFTSAGATIRQKNKTQWTFYYAAGSVLTYQINYQDNKTDVKTLSVAGEPVVGSNSPIAATLYKDSPRVYYLDEGTFIREVALKGTEGHVWNHGSLNEYEWPAYVNTSIAASGENSYLPNRVYVRVIFHEKGAHPVYTEADYLGGTQWTKKFVD